MSIVETRKMLGGFRRKLAGVIAGERVAHPDYLPLEENRKFAVDQASLRGFRDIHKGERCFIIGNGPSLNKTDLSLLENEYSIAVNGIFYKTEEMGYRPTYFVCEDNFVVADNLEKIKEYQPKSHSFFPSIYRSQIGEKADTSYFLMNRGYYEKTGPNFQIPRFSTDIAARAYCGQSVTYVNLQLAYHMGFSEVYLVGMDFSYAIPDSAEVSGTDITSTEDDPNHFHPDYFGKGKRWSDPQLDMVMRNYEMAKITYDWAGRKIYNATIGGHLELFERVDYNSLF